MGALERARAAVAGAKTYADGGTANGVKVSELALAEATLAVAEELRTANLIAWHLHLDAAGDLPDETQETARQVEERLGHMGGGPRG